MYYYKHDSIPIEFLHNCLYISLYLQKNCADSIRVFPYIPLLLHRVSLLLTYCNDGVHL